MQMLNLKLVIACAFLLSGLSVLGGQETASIYDKVFARRELPIGGQFLTHPKKQSIVYYCANWWLKASEPVNAEKQLGLYVSVNGGVTWKIVCHYFDFKKLFIHPETGKLYAIIQTQWLADDKKEFLVPYIADKAIESDDGKNWKDIMGKRKYLATITDIISDPDNPKRVSLVANVMRRLILQAIDDNYSDWEVYHE